MKFKIAIFASVILFATQLGVEPSKAIPASDAKPQTPLPYPTVILGFAGVLQPDCVRQVEAGEYRCAKRWAEVTHLLKSLVYQDVESQLIPPLQHQLAIADQSWHQFQTQHCQQLTQRLRNTPDFPIATPVCLARLNNDRILELHRGGEIITFQSRDPRFESLLDRLKLRNSSVQRHWEQYQTQYCQIEKALFSQNNLRLAQCHQRLREARIHQLEELLEAPASGLALSSDSVRPGIPELNCVDKTQLGLNRCAVYWSKTTQFLQSSIYGDWAKRLSKQYQSTFAIAQKYWQEYREAHCTELVEPFQEGSMAPMLYHRCLARLNNDRIADLKGIAVYDSEDEPQQAPVTSGQDTTQALWERYQTQYCKFESRFFGSQTRSKQCPNRLNLGRLRHIKAMMNTR
ncbi:hypothetical protein VF14_15835 [Nostoc linckia z18]|uniref:Lysozyme inhibitor LprI-like N-terminal domain-containing protein n=3 Tax=Nostoc linckia TaxID=92942 RepID=A0A9Q5ZDL1_NOSLI|nr:lysozyme inhibitor LprI family protein [Nostoc linckia]PHJ64674.1 hypothetical protein VF05_22305 [Nostoc linckia z3]PHJ71529.1 hypothetical protein VF03_19940 [Nostoc linckia z2]PHJ80234.1 hypothetical protein VF06_23345 [Nostoc linckia z4]PHJ85987.1 hypothetical protein VF07_22600 [Nostoc linckia z6]PHJ97390.1 hypothetical protein VF04_12545 [Nostoc linckia z7]PHK11766.1 hypothetical protein VF09_06185 [Nostoc linckia z9]PHK26634.1 hypothetical protein VF10_01760 [Nostoc linckia z13]PH